MNDRARPDSASPPSAVDYVDRDGAGVTRRLAQHVASLRYEQLPAAFVRLIKQCIVDTLGVSIGATSLAPEAAVLSGYVKRQGGAEQSTIWGIGGKTTAGLAAFANGGFGHMLDYDDVCVTGHVSICTIPVALALAERERNVSGQELIAAIAAGIDLMARIELAIPIPDWRIAEGWFATQLIGTFGAAATASRLLALDSAKTEHALGIAYTQLGGSYQMGLGEACDLRALQAAFAGQAGVLAADLANAGITGSKQVFEGKYGFFANYVRAPSPSWDMLAGALGSRFPAPSHHHFKQWPACDHTRPIIIALGKLFGGRAIDADDIERVEIIGGSGATRLLCEPIASKRRPTSSVDAKFSIPFTAAAVLARGTVSLGDYTERGLANPDVLRVADKIVWREALDPSTSTSMPRVSVRLANGESLSEQVTKDDLAQPATTEFLVAKYFDCVSFSATPIGERQAHDVLSMIDVLESLDDCGSLIRALYAQ